MTDLNADLKRDFPGTRLTHEPILTKHSQIANGDAMQLRTGTPLADQMELKLQQALEHVAAIRRLAGEVGQ